MDVKIEAGAEAIDIPTMQALSNAEYASYVNGELLFVDHHDVLRATLGGYPVATSAAQVEQLISFLQSVAHRMRAAE